MTHIFDIDSSLYGEDVLMRVAYDFTENYGVHLTRTESAIRVTLTPRTAAASDDAELAFQNALIDTRIRRDIADETRAIRELLIAQAFAEGDLLDHSGTEADYHIDPRGIAS